MSTMSTAICSERLLRGESRSKRSRRAWLWACRMCSLSIALSCNAGAAHDVSQGGAGLQDLVVVQGGVHQKHQGGGTQFMGHRQRLGGAPAGAVKGLFQIDLRARTLVAGHAACV